MLILCYAQDPVFKDIDKEILQEHGITVLDNPHGFLEMDEDTVIISKFPDVPIRSITADLTQPAIMIWNKVIDRKPLGGVLRTPPQNGLAGEEYVDQQEVEREPGLHPDPVR